jgi:hypothetical protein
VLRRAGARSLALNTALKAGQPPIYLFITKYFNVFSKREVQKDVFGPSKKMFGLSKKNLFG